MARLAVLFAAFLLALPAVAARVALTFDDGLDPDREPRAAAWYGGILGALRAADVQAMFFPALSSIGGERGRALVGAWSDAGHAIGNHTARHRNLASSRVTLDAWLADVVEADAALNRFATWRPMLRFPYLKEGDTPEKRDGVRAWMRGHGYRAAEVSIDASDWYYNQAYLALSKEGDGERLQRLQGAYVAHLLDRAAYYDGLAVRVTGRSPAHVLLLHTNAINAAWLPVVIAAFRERGWTLVSAAEAFEDPIYREQPAVLPAGESLVWSLAKAKGEPGLRYPAEDSVYEEPILRRLDLLPASEKREAK